MNSTTRQTTSTPSSGSRFRLRTLWLKAHRWLGLTVGLLLVLIGLTGSVLVFDHAIDEWLNPELLLTDGSGSRQSLQTVIEAAEQSQSADAMSVTKPRVENGVWSVWFSTGTKGDPKFTAVYVDPYTAEVKGQRTWGEDLMTWIYRLHFRLVAGWVGGVIVGICGLILMISVATGVYLWWPLWMNSWRAAFAVRGGPRFNYDLHKTVGIVSTVFLFVLAFTGVYMEFPQYVKPLFTVFSEETKHPRGLKSEVVEEGNALTADEAIAIAQREFPDAIFDHLHPPEGEEGTYEVAFRQEGEVQKSYGRTQVFLDQYTGDILTVRDPRQFTVADTLLAWQFPLHSGEAFGLIGRWLVFFSGLTPAALYATGTLMWWRRHRSRKRKKLAQTSRTQEPAEAQELVAAAAMAGSET